MIIYVFEKTHFQVSKGYIVYFLRDTTSHRFTSCLFLLVYGLWFIKQGQLAAKGWIAWHLQFCLHSKLVQTTNKMSTQINQSLLEYLEYFSFVHQWSAGCSTITSSFVRRRLHHLLFITWQTGCISYWTLLYAWRGPRTGFGLGSGLDCHL